MKEQQGITQEKTDQIFWTRLGNGELEEREDCLKIKKAIKFLLNIDLSISECAEFWQQRSDDWDGSWLNCSLESDEEIVKYFKEFYNRFYRFEEIL